MAGQETSGKRTNKVSATGAREAVANRRAKFGVLLHDCDDTLGAWCADNGVVEGARAGGNDTTNGADKVVDRQRLAEALLGTVGQLRCAELVSRGVGQAECLLCSPKVLLHIGNDLLCLVTGCAEACDVLLAGGGDGIENRFNSRVGAGRRAAEGSQPVVDAANDRRIGGREEDVVELVQRETVAGVAVGGQVGDPRLAFPGDASQFWLKSYL